MSLQELTHGLLMLSVAIAAEYSSLPIGSWRQPIALHQVSLVIQFFLYIYFDLEDTHIRVIGSYTIGALDYSDASNGGQFFQVISVSQTFQHPLYQDPKYPQDSFDFRLNKLDRSSSITPVDIDSDNLSDAYLSGKVSNHDVCFSVFIEVKYMDFSNLVILISEKL